MRGGTSSLFCYGYTGAGRTHTTLGYGGEKGLFKLAGEELALAGINEQSATEPYILLVSAIEIYSDQV